MNRRLLILGAIGFIIVAVILIPFLDIPEREQRDFVYSEESSTFYDPDLEARFAMNAPLSTRWIYSFKEHDYDVVIEQKLVKSSIMELEVEDYEEALTSIEGIVSSYNGYTSDIDERDDDGRKYGYVIIRVPREHFENAIEEIRSLGEVDVVKTTVKDVTEEYVDLEARLNNLKQQEERYLEVLSMAETVDEILNVEVQLERIRGEIEGLQGKMQYLEDSIDYATIQVNLFEPRTEKLEIGLGNALRRAVQAFFSGLRAVIIFLGYIIPAVIVFGLLFLGGRSVYRRFFKEDTH